MPFARREQNQSLALPGQLKLTPCTMSAAGGTNGRAAARRAGGVLLDLLTGNRAMGKDIAAAGQLDAALGIFVCGVGLGYAAHLTTED